MAARDPKSSRTGMRTRREMYMISTYIKLLRDEGYDNRDIWVMIHEYERGKGRTTGLAEQVAKEVGIDPAPPGWKVKRRQEPLKLYKNPEAAEPVRVRFKEVEEPAPQPRRNVRIREPAPEPPPSPPRPPRYVESNLEPLHVAPRRLGSDVPKIRNQPQTLEQALQTRIQRRAFRKANRKRYWELGGRYGHPQFPRYRQFPTGEEKQAITTSEKRMRRHAERYRRNPHAMRTIRSQDKPQNEPPNPGDSTSNPIPPLSSNPPVHRPDITGMPRSALIRIIELLPSESQIRLALAIPGTFQSPTAVNVFTLDAERQMKYLRRLRRHMRGGPQVTLPLLSEAIHDTSLDVNDISQILDGYAAHSGDVLNDMYLHRGFPPPLVAAIYASRADLVSELINRGADIRMTWPDYVPVNGPDDVPEMLESERLRRCPMRVAHNRCRAPHGFPRTYTDCPSLIHHAIYVHGVRYYSQMTDGSPPGSEENERNRVRRDNTEDTVAVMAFCERLHRLDQRGTDSAIAKGLEALIETGLYRAIGYLVDQMVKDIHVDESSRMKALNSLLMDFALEEIDTTGKSDGACREDRDRRDDLMRHLVAHGARIDTRHALDVAAVDGVHGHSFLVILGEIARINPNDNDEMYRYLANAKQSDNTRIFTVRLSRMMSGRVGDQARLLYATIRDGALRTYECLIANKTAVASRQAMYMAIERDDLNILGQLMALPDKPSADKDAPPNDGFVGPVYNAIGKPDDPADLIARQGRNILEAALVMRKFDVAHFLIQKGFPTAIDKAVLERVQLGAQELAKSIEPMTAEALKAAGEPPLDSGRILPIMTGSAGDAEAERTYNEMVESFKALVSILNKANDKANDKVNGKVLEIAVVGAGPRGTSVLERMCASVAEIIPAGTELIIHVITPCPAGAGKLWRTDLPTTLITGTIASEMTLYTDGTVKCQGPIRPGPTLYEWVQSNRPEHGLGPDDYVPRALYGEYLSWGFNQMLAHPTDNVRIVMHEARATNLEEGPDGRELLSLSNGERLPGISAVILAEEHLPVHPTPEEEQIRAYAEKAGLTYIAPSMPHDVELSVVKAGEPVLMRGLGFAFMDYVTLLTLGRGGRFETVGTNLQYIPSGNEPRIYAGSPQGMPYLALGDNKKTAADYHEPFIFNDEVVDLLRERANLGHSLDFNIDIWPLMVKEVEMAYYDSLLGGGEEFSNEFREAFIDTQPSTDEESQVLNDFEFPADDRLRWEEFAYPYRSKTFASPDEWQKWLLEHLHDDVTQAEFGNTESPVKAAACALYDLGDKLRELISQARLTEESRRIIHNDFAPLYAFICRGPTRLQALQLIALIKANIVTIVGPELEVRYGPNSWTVDSPHIPGSQVSVTTLIEARVPSADVRRTGDELLWNMFKNKECRLHTMDGYESGGLDVTPRPFNIIDAQGVAHPRRFALGVPTDGAEWLNTTAPKPGRNSSTLLDSDAVARAALAIAAS
ncbi:FAD-NAD(P)-binding-domain-containing protein [Daldinia caldariorum]|uniref:FAD-NAD(P)-binding-domain-containing protein n=1 Tax=Daldinia caldariorum TaxID=326644 RepID=UPI002007AE55|nr:FAD-NAD(P)-binding-domain-containing protein [Daldinia caldariorum]KAI1465948.1 FAD-NAD(P)-binding-domain-containing protein [Daldinia caldariorum]